MTVPANYGTEYNYETEYSMTCMLLLDIDASILANFAAFTPMLKIWESYTTNCIATME